MQQDRIVRDPECKKITGLSRTSRWRLEREKRFPCRRRIGKCAVGWSLIELLDFIKDPEGWVKNNKSVA